MNQSQTRRSGVRDGAYPALVPRSDFLGIDETAYLYSAAEGPMLAACAAALQEYVHQKSRGEAGRAHHATVAEECRAAVARLLGATREDVAFMASASDGINAVAGLIDFRDGDNVVTDNLEFPSVVLPWLRLRRRGVEVRVVRHRDWDIPTDAVLGAVNSRTRLVALSHVSYINGLRQDIETIGAALRGSGTVFLVDATQALGILPVPAASADFVVASSYKWLLGIHGLGILYWNRERLPDAEPAAIGRQSVVDAFAPHRFEKYTLKPDAGRFGLGFVNYPTVYALGKSVPYLLDAGVERMAAHTLGLGARLIERLQALRLEVITPGKPERRGASISFTHPDADRIGRELAQRGIAVWAGDGRVRASIHLFNDSQDIDRLVAALEELASTPSRARSAAE
jgi:selenocysteine lyase/cysteine desulfurase